MYKLFLGTAVAALLLLIISADSNQTNSSSGVKKDPLRAAKGDSVWIFLNHVKGDRRQEFEEFIHKTFWAASTKLSAADQKLFKQTRVLHPVAPEADGSYTYVFIMDPVVSGGDYDIDHLLVKMYGAQKAKEESDHFAALQSAEQSGYRMIQSED